MNFIKSLKFALILFAFSLTLFSCSDDSSNNSTEAYSKAKIIVFSDPHYYDPSLGTSGSAFENAISGDRKFLAESDALTQAMIGKILASDANIVLISGDLTKDGEKVCHQKFASYLKQLTDAGKKVLVVPGNHDINNPSSASYSGSHTIPVANISPAEFKEIYSNCGYNSAYSQDSSSLSYAVEPIAGVVFIMMDACKYANGTGEVGGAFNANTLNWVKSIASAAKAQNKTIMGVMHHGVIEHFNGEKSFPLSSDYVVDDYQNVEAIFAENGIKAVFTGHFHANDIVKANVGSNFLFDIETGSLVSAPCQYKYINLLSDGKMQISTNKITSINYDTKGEDFQTYANRKFLFGMTELSATYLKSYFSYDSAKAAYCAPYLARAFAAHYAGDETIDSTESAFLAELKAENTQSSIILSAAMQTILTDLPPKDNNITLDLISGAAY